MNQVEYDGTFVQNKMEGEGTMRDHKQQTNYKGEFYEGERHGEGTADYPNGNKFTGIWENNIPKKG